LLDGAPADATPVEREIVSLARITCERPARLSASDLRSLRALVGDEAIDLALVACAFHFINRIADLLGVDPELLPAPARRIEPLRRAGVWFAGRVMRRFDLRNRAYNRSYEEAVADIAPIFERVLGRAPRNEFDTVRARPKLVEAVRLALEERERSSVGRATIARVHAMVEAALPRDRSDVEGIHARPDDPLEAFAFVGTRYAARTTRAMIDRLRDSGYDDAAILDLAIAVADANQWHRMYRLLDLDPAIFTLADGDAALRTAS
jgi:hypothetical protein